MANPGGTMNHGSIWYQPAAALSMPPHVGVGGWMPTPRNARAASKRMFVGISRVE
jgi:hypothetical protein